jgi:hypothetical protein
MTTYTIRYRRPEAPSSIVVMGVPNSVEAAAQVDRLRALGYTIHDLTPPLPVPETDGAA